MGVEEVVDLGTDVALPTEGVPKADPQSKRLPIVPVRGPNQDGTGQIDAVDDVVDPSRMGGSKPRNVVSGLAALRSGESAR